MCTVGHTIPPPKQSPVHLNKRSGSIGLYLTPHGVSSDVCAVHADLLPGAEQLMLYEHDPSSVIQLRCV